MASRRSGSRLLPLRSKECSAPVAAQAHRLTFEADAFTRVWARTPNLIRSNSCASPIPLQPHRLDDAVRHCH